MRTFDHEPSDERDELRSRARPDAPAGWHAAAGNTAVRTAVASGVLPTRAVAGLEGVLARAPAARLQRQEVEEEEEQAPAEEAPPEMAGVEVPQGPVAEKLLGPEDEEVELPE